MSRPADRPPRAAEWFAEQVSRVSPWRETTLGDLREEYADEVRHHGRRRADAWYWGQSAALAGEVAAAGVRGFWNVVRSGEFSGGLDMRSLLMETRLAVRSLTRQPLVTAAVVLTVALGLGANAAAFSMMNVLVLKPFLFDNIDRLTIISEQSPQNVFPRESVSPGSFFDWRQQADRFDGLAAFVWNDANLAGGGEPERVHGFFVTGNFFELLNASPALGRLLRAGDDVPGRDSVLMISDGLWKRRFGGRPDIVGSQVLIDGAPFEIVGVAAAGFFFPLGGEYWRPLAFPAGAAAQRRQRSLTVIGRLAPGTTVADAQSQMTGIGARLRREHPVDNRDVEPRVQTLALGMADVGMPSVLAMMQAGAFVVLLIGSANVANLLLARGTGRRREMAIRLAMGASRPRIVRQLLVESLVLAALAVPVSLGVAAMTLSLIQASMPASILPFVPGWDRLGVDLTVVLVTCAGAVVAALVFGLAPAIQTSKPSLVDSLREGGRSIAGSRSHQRTRRAFVVAELALALPLLVAAGLAASGGHRFANGPQGYDPQGVIQLRTTLAGPSYAGAAERRQFAERLIAAAAAVPGVASTATINLIPSSDSNTSRTFAIEGQPPADPTRPPSAMYRVVSPRYFETMAIPITSGRDFTASDGALNQPVAVVSESFARRHWPNEPAVGKRLRTIDTPETPWLTVVGIAGDVIDDWFNRRNAPALYVPMMQRPSSSVTLVARTAGDPAGLAGSLRQALKSADPHQPASLVATLNQTLHERTTGLQMVAALMGCLGALALGLAAVGIYSLMAYDVSQRRHEIGVRMALGATRGAITRLTIGQAARLSTIGLGLGVVLSWLSARFVEAALFGIIALDATLLVGLTATLGVTAIVSSLVPARQAASVDPVVAMRE